MAVRTHQVFNLRIPTLEDLLIDNFRKCYVIKSANGENLWKKVDTINANNDLERCLTGSPKRVNELMSEVLLIEVGSR